MGDAKRYYSRDVIRIGGERVAVNPILTPGEPGREQRTQFEEEVHEMVQRQNNYSFDDSKKLKFVEKNKVVNTPDDDWAGLRTSSEYAQLLEEKKRRRELGRYQLPSVRESVDCSGSNEIEEVIAYERNKPANREDDLASLPTRLCRIYAKIEVLRRKYEDSERLQLLEESAREKPLSVTLDREVDELLSLYQLKTNLS